jgi:hypothetical protein
VEHILNSENGTGHLQSPRRGSVSPTEKIIVNVQPWMIFWEVPTLIKEERAPAAEIKPSGSMDLSGASEITPPDEVVAQFSQKVAQRWGCSTETVKRRGRDGTLRSLHFNGRNVRYRLADVEKVEREAETRIRGS